MSARQHLLLVVSPLGDARSRTRADPNKLGWIGHYRVDKNKTACDNLTTADDATLASCTSWAQCSTGPVEFSDWASPSPDNAGDCPIDEKCAVLQAARKYGSSGRRGATESGVYNRRDEVRRPLISRRSDSYARFCRPSI